MNRPTVSFDVFDTLLTRNWAEPHDLFVALAESLDREGIWSGDPFAFAAHRRAAEKDARRELPNGEIGFRAIHARLAQALRWSDSQSERAMQIELELESSAIVPVAEQLPLVEDARRVSGRVLFLSDMYLPGDFLRELLTRAGFFHEGDLLFVSGDVGVGKGCGLFEHVRAQLGLDFAHWTHHGDNPHSDGAAARRHGIRTQLRSNARLTSREHRLRGPGAFATPERSRLAAACRLARLEAPAALSETQRTLWNIGATVAGPLFWVFTRWSLQEAARRRISDVYFLARGGQIFWKIAEALREPPPVRRHYLLTSRLAFAGAFDRMNRERLRELAAPSLAHHSIRQALSNVGLEAGAVTLPNRWPRERWDENLSLPERAALADWLLGAENLPKVQAALSRRGMLARRYLHECGLSRDSRAAVVDTGWMGTIQKNIEHLLGDDGSPAAVDGFYLGLSSVRELVCRGESAGFTNMFCPLALRRDTTHLILLELFARGDHGPLVGFVENGDRVVPRCGEIPERQREEVRLFQRAVLSFVDYAERTIAIAPDADLARAAIENYLDFFRTPTRSEAEAIGTIEHADQMLEQRHTTLCRPMSVGEALTACMNYRRRPPGWWLSGQAQLGPAAVLRAYQSAKRLKWWVKSRLLGQPQ